MAAIGKRFGGPSDVKISKRPNGSEQILINGIDMSMVVTRYEIMSRPNDLKELVLHIPIGSIKMFSEDRYEITQIGDKEPKYL